LTASIPAPARTASNDALNCRARSRTRNRKSWQKEFNTQINKIRYIIERAIANFKTWRIMHTDYRRPLTTFPETISAAVALHFMQSPE
jgi:hypothetical protein